jgi:hypothetical protein
MSCLVVELRTELVEATDELQGSDRKNKHLLVGYFAHGCERLLVDDKAVARRTTKP